MTDAALERLSSALHGRYAIERELGRGGMATVYLARDLKHHRSVAIKLLSPDLSALLGRDRFLREIQVTARLQHPNVLALHDSGEADGLLYYVMPYVEGESLRHRLRRETRLAPDEALRLTTEVADALDYAHAQGIVHRDIKPENILLSRGHALVADFGIGHVAESGGENLTATGLVVGTPAYMSPEQACGEPVSARSDVYSLAAVLFEMLAGSPAFSGATPRAVLARRLKEPPPSVRALRREVSRSVDAAIQTAMDPDPTRRFATAAEFVAACGAARAPRVPGDRSRWMRPGLVAAVTVAAVAAMVLAPRWALHREGSTTAPGAGEPRLAVLPWAVRGERSLDYLGEGMVDLLSGGLDGAVGWRVVDPNSLIAFVRKQCGDGVTPDCGERAARRFGATRYVMGTIVAVGQGRIQLTATPYEPGRGAGRPVQATGSLDSLDRTVGEVARALMVGADSAASSRLTEVAAVSTTSVTALKAYLEGVALFRAGHYCPSAETLRRAIAEDTTFALAYYRLAMADSWGCETAKSSEARFAADAAIAHSARLPERDRRMLRAFRAYLVGDVVQADSGYRTQVQDYPDDIEAWYMLGETLMHHNVWRGRSSAEAREPFERTATADLPPIGAPYHLVHIAILDGRLQEAETLATRFVRLFPSAGPNGDHTWLIRFAGRLAAGDSIASEELVRGLEAASPARRRIGEFVSRQLFADLPLARRINSLSLQASRTPDERLAGETDLAGLTLSAGQPSDAYRRLSKLAAAGSVSALVDLVIAATFLPAPAPRLELATLKTRVARMDSTRVGVSRLALLAILDLRLGDSTAAIRQASRLAGWTATGDSAIAHALARAVLAEQAWAAGHPDWAMERLGGAAMPVAPPGGEDLGVLQTYALFVQAELAAAVHDESAIGRYLAVAEHDDAGYQAPASLRLGQLYEAQGDRRRALWHYGRFVRLWQDCEPGLRPLLKEGRRGVQRLTAEPRS